MIVRAQDVGYLTKRLKIEERGVMTVTVADNPARGRKHCPGCDKYPGVRSSACPNCGHSFEAAAKTAKPETAKFKVRLGIKSEVKPEPKRESELELEPDKRKTIYATGYKTDQPYIIIPAGKCPVELKEISIQAIKEWMAATREAYAEGYLSTEGLSYWARRQFPTYVKQGDEYVKDDLTAEKIVAIINEVDGIRHEDE